MAIHPGERRAFDGLGRALRWVRQRQGKKQYEVADAAGITKAMLSSYENGRQRPALDTLERILGALEIDLDYLAYAIRMVRQEDDSREARPVANEEAFGERKPRRSYLDLERTLGLDRRLEPGEEQAVGQMLEGFHNLLRYVLRRADLVDRAQAAAGAVPAAEGDDEGGGGAATRSSRAAG